MRRHFVLPAILLVIGALFGWLAASGKPAKVWETAFEDLQFPMMTKLRKGSFERAVDESPNHDRWAGERIFHCATATEYITQWNSGFREFPPRTNPGTIAIEQVMENLTGQGSRTNRPPSRCAAELV